MQKFFVKAVAYLFPQLGVKSLDTRLISTIPEEVSYLSGSIGVRLDFDTGNKIRE